MKISTFSVVVGSRGCDARCPFCVSRMTGFGELPKTRAIHGPHFRKAIMLAERSGATTLLITGKGEPTLYPRQITEVLQGAGMSFPLVELQTNALRIGDLAAGKPSPGIGAATLRTWQSLGLNTIAISVVDIDQKNNGAIYRDPYPDLATTIKYLKGLGFTVRLCLMMLSDFVNSWTKVKEVVAFCKANDVDQLTMRPVTKPSRTEDEEAYDWITNKEVDAAWLSTKLEDMHEPILRLPHGGTVYDFDGQNVCLTDCLTVPEGREEIRTLIFYTNGRLTYHWHHQGAVLLAAGPTSDLVQIGGKSAEG